MAEAVISIKEGLAYIIKKGNRQAVASCRHTSLQTNTCSLCPDPHLIALVWLKVCMWMKAQVLCVWLA